MVASPAGWMLQRALRGSGRPARFAAGYLCRRYRRATQRYVDMVVRLMCHARDDLVVRRARVTLEESWSYQSAAREAIWYSIQKVMKDVDLPDGNDVPWLVNLAMLTDRLDRVGRYDQLELARLLLATMAEQQPHYVVEACRRILRALPEGPGREMVWQQALAGDPEARAAAGDAGYLPAEPALVPLFLFCTEQWDLYDRLDPDGRELAKHSHGYSDADWRRLSEVAGRTGRRCPPAPRRPADSRAAKPEPYVPGGTATSGTGGFTVHGV